MLTTLIGIQTICVVTSTAYLGYKIAQQTLKNTVQLTLIKKEGKFKYYRIGGK
ncbi:hypothetical protein ABEV41_00325 [Geobacillus thermodenitrificans]|uniref:hypothetical protein n=1 Tax=Geobacillus thermodenitrificans TaxID=33940 RepID=UPI003D25468F